MNGLVFIVYAKNELNRMKVLTKDERQFFKAAILGDVARVRDFLSKGVFADVRDNQNPPCWDQTALMYAARGGHLDVVKVLIKAGADVSARDKNHSESAGEDQPLHYAVRSKSNTVVDELINSGADLNALNSIGDTPLNIAVSENNVDAIRLLLRRGADLNLNSKGKRFRPPASVAAHYRNLSVLILLLETGANPNLPDELGQTAIHAAALAPDAAPLVEVLIKHGCNADVTDKLGQSPIFLAVLSENVSAVRILASAGVHLNGISKRSSGTILDFVGIAINNLKKRIHLNADDEQARKDLSVWEEMHAILVKTGAKCQSELKR